MARGLSLYLATVCLGKELVWLWWWSLQPHMPGLPWATHWMLWMLVPAECQERPMEGRVGGLCAVN